MDFQGNRALLSVSSAIDGLAGWMDGWTNGRTDYGWIIFQFLHQYPGLAMIRP